MAYYNSAETQKPLEAIRKILVEKNLDAALVYFDELNVANGWYLTGWCGQFEKGAVLVPATVAWTDGIIWDTTPPASAQYKIWGCKNGADRKKEWGGYLFSNVLS